MNEQKPDREQLLFDYYDGKLGEAGRNEVKSWIEASEENRRTARRIYSLLLATDTNRIRPLIHTEEALDKVKRESTAQKQRKTWWQVIQQIAAVLFLPLITFLIWQQSLLNDRTRTIPTLEVRTNPGMTTRLTLPDSTVVYLNSSSVLSYPAQFDKTERTIRLSGEAYFEVTQDPKRRFVVHTPAQSAIEVYGTCFNVEAYPDDPYITTTLTEGKVGFIHTEGNTTLYTPMEAGEKLRYDVHTHELTRTRTTGTSELSWKDGLIIFQNTPFKEALRMLEKRFDVEFIVTNPKLDNDRFTGTFSTQRLERILQYFEISSNIHWKYADDPTPERGKAKIEIH
ncbi:MAG TPA: DUF4974 domain-containing protein [Candidatus Bacteroides pullicola]|uniref:DUF4974 domain-containing protein n=1 Tax=Candidatus Bacteroides pullicola TaxID=2838475 RepID=A0A9D1ZH34_9BACE|nr:DUF4974 domain-containing protein [Candidatus Bacteroides pullicola]